MDTGQTPLPYGDVGLSRSTLAWLKSASHLFYAFHWYGSPKPVSAAVHNAVTLATRWKMPALLTEYGGYGEGCAVQAAAGAAMVGTSYWHYSDYCYPKHCAPGVPDGYCPLDTSDVFGACITGWGSGNSSFKCTSEELAAAAAAEVQQQ